MRRREFITALGGAAVAWPLAARAQQPERMRHIGVLTSYSENDSESVARLAAFRTAMNELGWTEGRNVRIDTRWAGRDADLFRKYAAELVALAPDVVLANTPLSVLALQQASRTVPIVFVAVTDPVGLGIVRTLARPGGNATGFTPAAEFSTSAKWLELLREIAPGVRRVGVLREPSNPSATPQFAAIQVAATALGVEVSALGLRDADEIERGVTAFARSANGGLIVTRISEAIAQQDLIIELAARHRLPAVYPFRSAVTAGGLISYGSDPIDQMRRAAGYVDRILKGEKPADLPVQAPTKFELVINLETAKALGLTVPASLLATADEVIE